MTGTATLTLTADTFTELAADMISAASVFASGAITQGGTTAAAGGTVAPTNYFPANAGLAPFPSPENSTSMVLAGAISGAPYLRDAEGVVWAFDTPPVATTAAIGMTYAPAGTEHYFNKNGVRLFSASQMIIRQGQMYFMDNGTWFYGPGNGNGGTQETTPPTAWASGTAPTGTVAAGGTVTAAAPPVPVTTVAAGGGTPIVGATINGAVHATTALQTLVNAIPSGGTLTLPAMTITDTAAIPVACTIQGAGIGKTILDGTGVTPTFKKALLLPLIAGVTIKDMTIQNASISAADGANAAGVRDNADGIGFTLDTVELTKNQNGILTFASDITISNSHIHDNGASNIGGGFTHEMYINGAPTTTTTLTNNIVTCGTLATHALHCRSGKIVISGGTYTSNPDTNPAAPVAGSVIDIPNGGIFSAIGATFVLAPSASNTLFYGYAMENADNLAVGVASAFTNCVFTDGSGTGGKFQNGGFIPSATLTFTGDTYTAATAPVTAGTGFASVTGTIAKG